MTHVKTADAFSRLVGFCTGFGGKYNPGRQNLRIESLANQLEEVMLALERVKNARTAYDNEVNRRKQKYDQLPRLASSILRTLEASGASTEKLDDARQFVQMITGKSTRSRPPIASGQAQVEKERRSQRQLAFVSKVDSFSKFAQAVATEPLYLAYEPEFSKEGLKATVLELSQLNKQVDEARAKWSNSLIDRNQVMYDKDVSLYNTAKAVKKYVRAIYGHDSAQYELLKTLTFIKQTKK